MGIASVTALQASPVVHTGTWTGFVNGGVSASANASAKVDVAAIELAKTVWGNPDLTQCAPSSVITRTGHASVPRYCYTVQNTGSTTLSVHSLVDSRLGDLLTGAAFELGPGESYFVTTASPSINVTTTNVATWTASVDGVEVTGVATATVNLPMPRPRKLGGCLGRSRVVHVASTLHSSTG